MQSEDPEKDLPDGPPAAAPVTLAGTTYPPLADGAYDAIILVTGLKECVLSGLLAVKGLRVLHLDRNNFYGGECASLNVSVRCSLPACVFGVCVCGAIFYGESLTTIKLVCITLVVVGIVGLKSATTN